MLLGTSTILYSQILRINSKYKIEYPSVVIVNTDTVVIFSKSQEESIRLQLNVKKELEKQIQLRDELNHYKDSLIGLYANQIQLNKDKESIMLNKVETLSNENNTLLSINKTLNDDLNVTKKRVEKRTKQRNGFIIYSGILTITGLLLLL